MNSPIASRVARRFINWTVKKLENFKKITAQKVSVLGVILVRIFPHLDWMREYSVRIRENTDQNNSEYGHFLHSESLTCLKLMSKYSAGYPKGKFWHFDICATKLQKSAAKHSIEKPSLPLLWIFKKVKNEMKIFRQPWEEYLQTFHILAL